MPRLTRVSLLLTTLKTTVPFILIKITLVETTRHLFPDIIRRFQSTHVFGLNCPRRARWSFPANEVTTAMTSFVTCSSKDGDIGAVWVTVI